MRMRQSSLSLLYLLLICAVARAETPAEAVRDLVAAERKFYQTGQEQGTRAAFLAFLADDAIVFRLGLTACDFDECQSHRGGPEIAPV